MHVFVGVFMCTYVHVCKHWRADLNERHLTLLSFLPASLSRLVFKAGSPTDSVRLEDPGTLLCLPSSPGITDAYNQTSSLQKCLRGLSFTHMKS